MLIERLLNLMMFAEDAGDTGGGDAGKGAAEGGETGEAGEGEAGEESTEEGKAKEPLDTDKSKETEGDDEGKAKDGDEEGDVYTAESFEIPEGMELDTGMMDEFLKVANNKELSGKDRDQALVSMYAEKVQAAKDSQLEAWETVREGWKKESENHKEFGGAQYKENKGVMMNALTEFGSPDLVKMGEQFGWMDNPHFQSFLFNVGKKFVEGKTNSGGGGDGGSETIENRWYGEDGNDKA